MALSGDAEFHHKTVIDL